MSLGKKVGLQNIFLTMCLFYVRKILLSMVYNLRNLIIIHRLRRKKLIKENQVVL